MAEKREREVAELPPELRWIVRRFTKLDEVIEFITGHMKRTRELLEEIRDRLPPAPPVVLPPEIEIPKPPKVTVLTMTSRGLKELFMEAGEGFGILRLANDCYVETIDLGTDRSAAAKIREFSKLKGIALTILKNTGTFDLYLNEKDDLHKIPVDALTYPQTLLIDWFKLKTVYIGNTAQSGKEATLIAWKRVLKRKS